MNAHMILLLMAFVCFIVGIAEWPPFGGVRMLCLGAALITLSLIVG